MGEARLTAYPFTLDASNGMRLFPTPATFDEAVDELLAHDAWRWERISQ